MIISYLEGFLVLLGLSLVDLLYSLDVLLDVDHSVLPRLESFGEQSSGLSGQPQWLGYSACGVTEGVSFTYAARIDVRHGILTHRARQRLLPRWGDG